MVGVNLFVNFVRCVYVLCELIWMCVVLLFVKLCSMCCVRLRFWYSRFVVGSCCVCVMIVVYVLCRYVMLLVSLLEVVFLVIVCMM